MQRREDAIKEVVAGVHELRRRDGARILQTLGDEDELPDLVTTESRRMGGWQYTRRVWLLMMELKSMSSVGSVQLSPLVNCVLHRFGICVPGQCVSYMNICGCNTISI